MSDFERWLRDTIDGQLWEILACIAEYLAFCVLSIAWFYLACLWAFL